VIVRLVGVLSHFNYYKPLFVKVKVTPWRAYAGTEDWLRYTCNPVANWALEGGRWWVSTTLLSFFRREINSVALLPYGWVAGIFLTCAENLTPSGIQSADRPVCSESLYRLSYPGRLRGKINHTISPLNAELNHICHLLILLGDLTFVCPCIVSIFQYISNKMQR
jgi:hypothetical protein